MSWPAEGCAAAFIGHGNRHDVIMILFCHDSVFFPDDAKGVVGGDRIMEGQNHNGILFITLSQCDLAELFAS